MRSQLGELRRRELTASDTRATRTIRGRRAEATAAEHLVARGFVIEGTNVRIGRLEIDLVATKDDLVVVVEVRLRGAGSYQSALESVDKKKQERLVRAATALYTKTYAARGMRLRFDVVALTEDARGDVVVEHVTGAFTA